jgi:hypothetical protein
MYTTLDGSCARAMTGIARIKIITALRDTGRRTRAIHNLLGWLLSDGANARLVFATAGGNPCIPFRVCVRLASCATAGSLLTTHRA